MNICLYYVLGIRLRIELAMEKILICYTRATTHKKQTEVPEDWIGSRQNFDIRH